MHTKVPQSYIGLCTPIIFIYYNKHVDTQNFYSGPVAPYTDNIYMHKNRSHSRPVAFR
jgi:hypothetical protein